MTHGPFLPPSIGRRTLLGGAVALAALPLRSHAAEPLVATPRQTEGPFYPRRFPSDADADLVSVAGQAASAQGTVLHLAGRVLDRAGRPLAGARVEIWQSDVHGHYHHVDRPGRRADPSFQGYGRATAEADGAYRFRTIRPVPYDGRTAHIHVAVEAPGFARLITQMYVAGEPGNDRDPVLGAIRDARARDAVTVALAPLAGREPGALAARFDLVLA